MWEAKVVFAADMAAAVDAAADTDVVERNWKHKVTPDWGDLIIPLCYMKHTSSMHKMPIQTQEFGSQ